MEDSLVARVVGNRPTLQNRLRRRGLRERDGTRKVRVVGPVVTGRRDTLSMGTLRSSTKRTRSSVDPKLQRDPYRKLVTGYLHPHIYGVERVETDPIKTQHTKCDKRSQKGHPIDRIIVRVITTEGRE